MPKCGNDAGETTSTSCPAARSASTWSATKRPATSPAPRGYEVARTQILTQQRGPKASCRRRPALCVLLVDLTEDLLDAVLQPPLRIVRAKWAEIADPPAMI